MTGSSARSLRRKGVNLLAGRALTYQMHPLTIIEQEEAFNLRSSMQLGHLPAGSVKLPRQIPERLCADLPPGRSHAGRPDAQHRPFLPFLEVASFSQGQTINISSVAREAQIERPGSGELFFHTGRPAHSSASAGVQSQGEAQAHITKEILFFDAGVYRAIRPTGPLDSDAEMDGPALETLVLEELRAINDYLECGYKIYFWRTRNQLEIDFILYGSNGLLAIEIKRSRQVQYKETRALREFKKDYPLPLATCFTVAPPSLFRRYYSSAQSNML